MSGMVLATLCVSMLLGCSEKPTQVSAQASPLLPPPPAFDASNMDRTMEWISVLYRDAMAQDNPMQRDELLTRAATLIRQHNGEEIQWVTRIDEIGKTLLGNYYVTIKQQNKNPIWIYYNKNTSEVRSPSISFYVGSDITEDCYRNLKPGSTVRLKGNFFFPAYSFNTGMPAALRSEALIIKNAILTQ